MLVNIHNHHNLIKPFRSVHLIILMLVHSFFIVASLVYI